MAVGIIILNYNKCSDTIQCIKSIENVNTADIKIIIVDNGSSKQDLLDSKNFITSNYSNYAILSKEPSHELTLPYITLYDSKHNDGYAQGNNKGLRIFSLDNSISHVLILNNDIIFTEDIIPELLNSHSRISNIAFISPILLKKNYIDIDYTCARKSVTFWEIIFYHLLNPIAWHFVDKHITQKKILFSGELESLKQPTKIELQSGSCLLTSIQTFKDLNYFDPNTFLYWEENILQKKATKLGLENYIHPKCKCIHLGGQTTSQHATNKFLLKCGYHSCYHYMTAYENINFFKKFLLKVSMKFNYVLESTKMALAHLYKG